MRLADAPAVENDLVAACASRDATEAITVPAKSMPGTSGKRRTTGALPVIASPSL